MGEQTPATVRESGDAIVRITTSTICGTDLHILKGDVPSVTAGRILGHEGVGIIEAVGSGVATFPIGDRVLISCITACGLCDFCRKGMPSHCRTGGWILGNTIDGTQPEYVRVPHAETSLYQVPPELDEEAVGTPSAFDTCQAIVAAGGRIANIGVHGKPVQLHLEKLWDRNIVLTTRLVDTVTTPLLLKLLQTGRLHAAMLVTHRFRLDDIMNAYDTFANAANVSALKVILHGHDSR